VRRPQSVEPALWRRWQRRRSALAQRISRKARTMSTNAFYDWRDNEGAKVEHELLELEFILDPPEGYDTEAAIVAMNRPAAARDVESHS
jgi:hypothetical protein